MINKSLNNNWKDISKHILNSPDDIKHFTICIYENNVMEEMHYILLPKMEKIDE